MQAKKPSTLHTSTASFRVTRLCGLVHVARDEIRCSDQSGAHAAHPRNQPPCLCVDFAVQSRGDRRELAMQIGGGCGLVQTRFNLLESFTNFRTVGLFHSHPNLQHGVFRRPRRVVHRSSTSAKGRIRANGVGISYNAFAAASILLFFALTCVNSRTTTAPGIPAVAGLGCWSRPASKLALLDAGRRGGGLRFLGRGRVCALPLPVPSRPTARPSACQPRHGLPTGPPPRAPP